jgi:hypothetical protein
MNFKVTQFARLALATLFLTASGPCPQEATEAPPTKPHQETDAELGSTQKCPVGGPKETAGRCGCGIPDTQIEFRTEATKALKLHLNEGDERLAIEALGKCPDYTPGPSGETLLHLAAAMGFTNLASKLLETNLIDPNAQDHAGRTPLHLATEQNHMATIECLFREGASVNAQDKAGKTPLQLALDKHGAVAGQSDFELWKLKDTFHYLDYFERVRNYKVGEPHVEWPDPELFRQLENFDFVLGMQTNKLKPLGGHDVYEFGDDLIVKHSSVAQRFENFKKSSHTIALLGLNRLILPKEKVFKWGGSDWIAEEKIDIKRSATEMQDLYEVSFDHFDKFPWLRDYFRVFFRELTVFFCESDAGDVKVNNYPLANNGGGIALVDLDYATFPSQKTCKTVKGILSGTGERSGFWGIAPPEFFDEIRETAAKHISVSPQSILPDEELGKLKKKREDQLQTQRLYRAFHDEKKIMTGFEPIPISAQELVSPHSAVNYPQGWHDLQELKDHPPMSDLELAGKLLHYLNAELEKRKNSGKSEGITGNRYFEFRCRDVYTGKNGVEYLQAYAGSSKITEIGGLLEDFYNAKLAEMVNRLVEKRVAFSAFERRRWILANF